MTSVEIGFNKLGKIIGMTVYLGVFLAIKANRQLRILIQYGINRRIPLTIFGLITDNHPLQKTGGEV